MNTDNVNNKTTNTGSHSPSGPPPPGNFPIPAVYNGINVPDIGTIDIWKTIDVDTLLEHPAVEADFEQQNELMPYWADVWLAARLLAHAFAQRRVTLNNITSAVELGAGTGLVGIVLAKLGLTVTLTDLADSALNIIRIHCRENGLNVGQDYQIEKLDILDPDSIPQHVRPDLVVGADILYEDRMAPPVAEAIARLLPTGGEAFIADPCRRTAAHFMNECYQNNCGVDELLYNAEDLEDIGIYGINHSCRIFRVRRETKGPQKSPKQEKQPKYTAN